ncbi:hypothetical protein [Pseudidiomarina sp.]|uniref:hypothetical protein n=1 Tax=Pseudidiomarina sp. TaxID=2081707 RepID=UPI003A978101
MMQNEEYNIEITEVTETVVYYREVKDDGIWNCSSRRGKFVENAYVLAIDFGKKAHLIQCVKHGLIELLDDNYREMLQDIIAGRPPRIKHHQTYLTKHKEKLEIWAEIHYWNGKGHPIKSSSTTDAVTMVSEEYEKSSEHVYKEIYLKLKKENASLEEKGMYSHLGFLKTSYLLLGQMAAICLCVIEYEDNGNIETNGIEPALQHASSKLGIELKKVKNLYQSCKEMASKKDKRTIHSDLADILEPRGYKLP